MSDSRALFRLEGRVALVTGAPRGLGSAMARALADAGAHVVLNDIDAAALTATCETFRANGLAAEASVFDVTDGPAVHAAMTALAGRHGQLDILVNNAGIAVYKSAADHDDAEWARVIDVNLTALHLVAREAVEGAVQAWLSEDARLQGVRRAVGLVEQALRGVQPGDEGLAGTAWAKASLEALGNERVVGVGRVHHPIRAFVLRDPERALRL